MAESLTASAGFIIPGKKILSVMPVFILSGFHCVDQIQYDLMSMCSSALFPGCPHHSSADVVRFCLSPVLQIRINAGISAGSSLKVFSDSFLLLIKIKVAAFSIGHITDLPDQAAADLPCMGIFCHEALGFSENAGKHAGGSVDHQLVPDGKTNIAAYFFQTGLRPLPQLFQWPDLLPLL
jgi:hypothetical protein